MALRPPRRGDGQGCAGAAGPFPLLQSGRVKSVGVSNHNSAQIKEADEILKAAAYPEAPLILWHWGSVDAPERKEFNGDPEAVKNLVINPQRVIVPAPGEGYCLKKLPEQAGL